MTGLHWQQYGQLLTVMWPNKLRRQGHENKKTKKHRRHKFWPAKCQWSCFWWNHDDQERRWWWCSTSLSRTSTAKCQSWCHVHARLSTCPAPTRTWTNLCPSAKQSASMQDLLTRNFKWQKNLYLQHQMVHHCSKISSARTGCWQIWQNEIPWVFQDCQSFPDNYTVSR